jgi:hypothetical protein
MTLLYVHAPIPVCLVHSSLFVLKLILVYVSLLWVVLSIIYAIADYDSK